MGKKRWNYREYEKEIAECRQRQKDRERLKTIRRGWHAYGRVKGDLKTSSTRLDINEYRSANTNVRKVGK